MPFAISIEPTNRCQLACIECPTHNHSIEIKKGDISLELFEKIIKEIHHQTFYLNLYFQGEPLLHNQITQMISIAKKYRIYTVLSTNAQNLDEPLAQRIVKSGLSKIIISMDGMTANTYNKYRIGGNIDKVKTAVETLIRVKKELELNNPKIIVQFLVHRFNEHEIKTFKQWARPLNIIAELKTMQIYNDFSFVPTKARYSRYELKENRWQLKKIKKNRCFRIWSQCVIRYDGSLLPCCYDKEGIFYMGNIKEKSLKELWHSKAFNDFRLKILKSKHTIKMCNNCPE
ncbi:MAG: SPASM domain-containing protein [Bacteroidales bacterium]|nr:SPASM domain-containing protein [Bacteroidales bacterium]